MVAIFLAAVYPFLFLVMLIAPERMNHDFIFLHPERKPRTTKETTAV